MDTSTRCTFTNKKGEPCQMRPLTNDTACWAHSTTNAAERHATRSAAGTATFRKQHLAAASAKPCTIKPADTTNVEDLQRFISDVMIAVGAGELPTAVANTLMSGARMAIQLCGLALDVKLASKIK